MTLTLRKTAVWVALTVAMASRALAQGSFQNLDFESPILPLVPLDSTYGFVAASNALPGWTAYAGTIQQTRVLNNNYSLGTAGVALLGPGWTNTPPVIHGSYSVMLQAGLYQGPASAAIAQSGLIPVTAKSVQMAAKFLFGNHFELGVTIGGVDIPMIALSSTPSYTLYGGDISVFAGQFVELRVSALNTPDRVSDNIELDSIQFSSQPIPEPGSLALFGAGALLIARRRLLSNVSS